MAADGTRLTIRSRDGTHLAGRYWPAQAEAVGTLVLSHGLGDHAARYQHVVAEMSGAFNVVGFDYRGHGTSPGMRGSVRHYDDLRDDLTAAIDHAIGLTGDSRVSILGHSHGALLALRALETHEAKINALVLSNPSFALRMPVPSHKLMLGHLLKWFAPGLALEGSVPAEWLSNDPKFTAPDPLRHCKVCAALFFGMQSWGARLVADAPNKFVPTFVLLSTNDRIVDAATGQLFYKRLGSSEKVLVSDPVAQHEPLNDVGWRGAVDQIVAWLTRQHAKTDRSCTPCVDSRQLPRASLE